MRVVIDTNVLVSGLVSPAETNPPARVVDRWIDGGLTVLVSMDLAAEYREVLLRPAFSVLGTVEERADLLECLLALENVHPVEVRERLRVVERDPGDDMVLECAAAGNADFIITGDEDLLALRQFRRIEIVSPRDFLRRIPRGVRYRD